jgi:hypothetical protein
LFIAESGLTKTKSNIRITANYPVKTFVGKPVLAPKPIYITKEKPSKKEISNICEETKNDSFIMPFPRSLTTLKVMGQRIYRFFFSKDNYNKSKDFK